jgi:hypothetical protein
MRSFAAWKDGDPDLVVAGLQKDALRISASVFPALWFLGG